MNPELSNPPNLFYSATLLIAGVACLIVGVTIYLRRKGQGISALLVMLLALSWWDITYAIFWLGFPGPTLYFWLDITMVGAYIVPTALLVFSLDHAGLRHWLPRRAFPLLWVEPLAAFLLQWTDPWHDLYFGGKRALNTTQLLHVGPAGWANIYYSYMLVFAAVVILLVHLFRSVGIYRGQTATILAAVIVPWLASIFSVSTGGSLPNADVTPFIFSVTALAISLSIWGYRLLDIMPIAHSVLIENMNEGVIVLDTRNRIVDINPAALAIVGGSASTSIGRYAREVFSRWEVVQPMFNVERQSGTGVSVGGKYLDLQVSPLRNRKGHLVGRLMVWHDITALKNAQDELEKLASLDGLTGALNRRSFMEKAAVEAARAVRMKKPLSILLMDIDHFKDVNDTYGHAAGDRVLVRFAKVFVEGIRKYDIFARMGGEEFALLIPDADAQEALQIAERLRMAVAAQSVQVGGKLVPITVSIGIAEMEHQGEGVDGIINRADKALYSSKNSGRNQSQVWQAAMEE